MPPRQRWIAFHHIQACHPETIPEYSELLQMIGPDDPTLQHGVAERPPSDVGNARKRIQLLSQSYTRVPYTSMLTGCRSAAEPLFKAQHIMYRARYAAAELDQWQPTHPWDVLK